MKIQLVLTLYDRLTQGYVVERQSFCNEYKITERTFYRYMNDISVFLAKNKSNCVLDVLEPNGEYYLKIFNGDTD